MPGSGTELTGPITELGSKGDFQGPGGVGNVCGMQWNLSFSRHSWTAWDFCLKRVLSPVLPLNLFSIVTFATAWLK